VVYEDERVMAFLDIMPISPGHVIVVPKSHVASLEDLSDGDFCTMTAVLKKIGKAVIESLGVKGYSLTLDNKAAANQRIPHVHFHLVPRKEGDGLKKWPPGFYQDGEAEDVLKKVKAKL